MQTKLKEIALVQMGYSFRARLEPIEKGNIAVIQMKDLTTENRVNISNLTRIYLGEMKPRHLVKNKDIIFRSRGLDTTAAILDNDIEAAIVAAPLLKIRVKSSQVLPEYLNWLINQNSSQAYFAKCRGGTIQTMISKQVLDNLEVIIPTWEKQWSIMRLAKLANKEQQLIQQLAARRKIYINKILMQLIKEDYE
jgi:restriction endonuclease S subunit